MMKSDVTALTLAGILSVSSITVFAETSGGNPPVDKGGMPPSTEMEAGTPSGTGGALPPGSVEGGNGSDARSEEHTSELQSLMRISYAVFCLKKKILATNRQWT